MLPGISSDALIDGDIKGEILVICFWLLCVFHTAGVPKPFIQEGQNENLLEAAGQMQ